MTMVTIKEESRRARKKAAVRERIIATAIELFARHGFEDVTVEHIADVVDLGKGTIYNYFKTKEDIVVAYMVKKERDVQARLPRLMKLKGSLASILTRYIQLQFRLKKPYHQFVRVFLAQMFLRTEQLLPYIVEMQKTVDPNLEALFGGLQKRGLLRRDSDVAIPDLINVFKTIHLGLTALWAVEAPPFRGTEKVLQQEIRLFCEGLEATK
ncbi:MAG TPA: TetR/AcrR family transcriptional regulator [Terriglobales bacterium]